MARDQTKTAEETFWISLRRPVKIPTRCRRPPARPTGAPRCLNKFPKLSSRIAFRCHKKGSKNTPYGPALPQTAQIWRMRRTREKVPRGRPENSQRAIQSVQRGVHGNHFGSSSGPRAQTRRHRLRRSFLTQAADGADDEIHGHDQERPHRSARGKLRGKGDRTRERTAGRGAAATP